MANSIFQRDIGSVSLDNRTIATYNIDNRVNDQRFLITEGDISSALGQYAVNMTDVSGLLMKLSAQRGQDIQGLNPAQLPMGLELYDSSGTSMGELTPDRLIFRGAIGGDELTGSTKKVNENIYRLKDDWNYGLRFENGLSIAMFWDTATGNFQTGNMAINLFWKSSPPIFVL